MLTLKAKEEEIRKVSQEGSEGKVAVNAPYAVIVTPGRELADQVGSSEKGSCLITLPCFKIPNFEITMFPIDRLWKALFHPVSKKPPL